MSKHYPTVTCTLFIWLIVVPDTQTRYFGNIYSLRCQYVNKSSLNADKSRDYLSFRFVLGLFVIVIGVLIILYIKHRTKERSRARRRRRELNFIFIRTIKKLDQSSSLTSQFYCVFITVHMVFYVTLNVPYSRDSIGLIIHDRISSLTRFERTKSGDPVSRSTDYLARSLHHETV